MHIDKQPQRRILLNLLPRPHIRLIASVTTTHRRSVFLFFFLATHDERCISNGQLIKEAHMNSTPPPPSIVCTRCRLVRRLDLNDHETRFHRVHNVPGVTKSKKLFLNEINTRSKKNRVLDLFFFEP